MSLEVALRSQKGKYGQMEVYMTGMKAFNELMRVLRAVYEAGDDNIKDIIINGLKQFAEGSEQSAEK
jgi:hypothetical protein